MFEEQEIKNLQDGLKGGRRPAPFNWKSHTVDELIRFRDEITQALPPIALKDMNLEEELLLQFHTLRTLQNQVLSDQEYALNQRTAIANSVTSSLVKLSDVQEKLYTTERFKAIENGLIRSLNKLPEEAAAVFIKAYEAMLENVDG